MSSLIDLNNIKESCIHCQSTGIIKHDNKKVGTICSCCRGRGYVTFEEGYIVNVSKKQNQFTNNKYQIKSKWNMIRSFYLFQKLQKRNDIDFIAFANEGILGTTNQWYKETDIKEEVISYEEYLNGLLPLPDEKNLCPQNFYDYPFDINIKCELECTEEQRNKCWQEFYKYKNSKEEKQQTIITKAKKLTPRKKYF